MAIAIVLCMLVMPLYSEQSKRFYESGDQLKFYTNETYVLEEKNAARKIEAHYGLASGLEFLALTIMFCVSFYILAKLLKHSKNLSSVLQNQRKELTIFWVTIAFGYGLRTIIQFLYGHYYLFIKQFFWRWMLYFITCPLLDIPNILYVFFVHYKTFKTTPVERIVESEGESSFQSQSAVSHLEILRINIAMNFHEIQANEAVFAYEYERVQKSLNKDMDLKVSNHASWQYVSTENYYPQLEVDATNEMAFSHKNKNRVSLNI